MSATIPAEASHIDPARVAALRERERARLTERTRRSGELHARAGAVMPGGVPSQFQKADRGRSTSTAAPARGCGTSTATSTSTSTTASASCASATPTPSSPPPSRRAWTPARTSRRRRRARSSSPRSCAAAGLPHWRFTNSGTESTLDAIHLARGRTGRDVIVKIEGTYHGHHDAVMVSVKPPAELMGPRERPNPVPYGLGYPSTTAQQTAPVPFNDAEALEGLLESLAGRVAGLIMEPAMMNVNIVPPVPRLPRARARAHPRPRRGADLRRGQDRRHRRGGRRDRAVRRHARRRVPRQGDLRRAAGRSA